MCQGKCPKTNLDPGYLITTTLFFFYFFFTKLPGWWTYIYLDSLQKLLIRPHTETLGHYVVEDCMIEPIGSKDFHLSLCHGWPNESTKARDINGNWPREVWGDENFHVERRVLAHNLFPHEVVDIKEARFDIIVKRVLNDGTNEALPCLVVVHWFFFFGLFDIVRLPKHPHHCTNVTNKFVIRHL